MVANGALNGKTALVTGSTSGIGLGIARIFAEAGAHVVLNGFGDPVEIERMRAGIAAEFGVEVLYHGADVGDAAAVDEMVKDAIATTGSVDILVNNAGIQFTAPIEEFPIDKWNAILATNLSAAFFGTRSVLPGMRKNNWGRIVNIASAHGLVASANKAAYVAAKHGVIGLTKVTALETAGSGITCNAICPGWVLTPLVQKQIDANATREGITVKEAELELLSEKQPSKSFVTPEQIGGLALFLCSDAAKEVTGAPLSIDGGWTAQ